MKKLKWARKKTSRETIKKETSTGKTELECRKRTEVCRIKKQTIKTLSEGFFSTSDRKVSVPTNAADSLQVLCRLKAGPPG